MTNQEHLANFIESQNSFARLFKRKEYDINQLWESDREELLQRIEIELSPENLSCDGELRGPAIKAKAARLNGAKAALLGKI